MYHYVFTSKRISHCQTYTYKTCSYLISSFVLNSDLKKKVVVYRNVSDLLNFLRTYKNTTYYYILPPPFDPLFFIPIPLRLSPPLRPMSFFAALRTASRTPLRASTLAVARRPQKFSPVLARTLVS